MAVNSEFRPRGLYPLDTIKNTVALVNLVGCHIKIAYCVSKKIRKLLHG